MISLYNTWRINPDMTESCSFGEPCRSHTHHDKGGRLSANLSIWLFCHVQSRLPGPMSCMERTLTTKQYKNPHHMWASKRMRCLARIRWTRRKAPGSNPNSCKGPKHRLYLNYWHQLWEAVSLRSAVGMIRIDIVKQCVASQLSWLNFYQVWYFGQLSSQEC